MQEQPLVQSLQKEIENPRADFGVEIEGAIHEFEVAHAPLVEPLHLGQKRLQRKRPSGLVQRRQTEFALERAAARGFDVDQPVGDVLVGIKPIRQRELIQRGSRGGDDLFGRRVVGEQSPAELPIGSSVSASGRSPGDVPWGGGPSTQTGTKPPVTSHVRRLVQNDS